MKSEKTKHPETLFIGIGNSGRGDDGLGWLFLDYIDRLNQPGIHAEYRYQLQVEDAALVSGFKKVVFIDASQEPHPEGFAIESCEPASEYFFSSHLQSPQTVLYLTETLYDHRPDALLITITGKTWGLGEKLSAEAELNLKMALRLFLNTYYPEIEKTLTLIPKEFNEHA